MNRRWLYSLLPTCLLMSLCSGCAQPPAPAATTLKDTRSEALAALQATEVKLNRAIAVRDVNQIETFFTPNAWLFPADAPMAKTHEERRAYWSDPKMSPGFTDIQGVEPNSIFAKSGELAVEYGSYFEVVSDKDGHTFYRPHTYVTGWERQADGSWKVATVMWREKK